MGVSVDVGVEVLENGGVYVPPSGTPVDVVAVGEGCMVFVIPKVGVEIVSCVSVASTVTVLVAVEFGNGEVVAVVNMVEV